MMKDDFKMSRRDIKKSHGGTSQVLALELCWHTLQSTNLEDYWFILEYTSHSSPFLSQSIEIRGEFSHSYGATTMPSIFTVMSSQHWSQHMAKHAGHVFRVACNNIVQAKMGWW